MKIVPSTFLRVWSVVLAAALCLGIIGVIHNGWQHPGDTIGVVVWAAVASGVVVIARRQKSAGRNLR